MKKPKAQIAMNALFMGIPITAGGRIFKLFKKGETIETPSFSGEVEANYWLGIKCVSGSKNETKYIGLDFTFHHMLNMLENLSDEAVALLAANITLNLEKTRKKRTCLSNQI